MTFELAVSAEMVFTDLPIIERVRRISDLGLRGGDLELARQGPRRAGRDGRQVLVDDRLPARRPDRPADRREVVRTAEQSIKAAEVLGVPRLIVHPGELVDGLPPARGTARPGRCGSRRCATLEALGELGAEAGVTFCLENLNTIVDHPGVPLARAKDTLALIEAVDHPNVKMMLDLYHAQIGEGNLIELVRRCGDAIGEIQVADVPGRCEPGTGEIHYPAIAKALRDMGYRGTVGLEAYASGDSVAALEAFRARSRLNSLAKKAPSRAGTEHYRVDVCRRTFFLSYPKSRVHLTSRHLRPVLKPWSR